MKKVLVVEDDTSIRELLIELLESEGYQVTASSNGVEALKSLEDLIPDLILMDIMMPIMDGYAFRKELLLNTIWNQIPVLAMSAQFQGQQKLSDYGIFNFINKPLELNHLLETVKSLS